MYYDPKAQEITMNAQDSDGAPLPVLRESPPAYDPLKYTLDAGGVEYGEHGWSLSYVLRQLPAETVRHNLMVAVSQKRWAVETGGLTLPGGATVGTGIDDQNRITSVIANAQLAGVASVDFKARDSWVTLTLDQVRGIATSIALHVQACFSAERAHHEALAAAADEDLWPYDINVGWPA